MVQVAVREIAISRFKATCFSVLEDVRRTKRPIRITQFGKPVAEIRPPTADSRESWLGSMRGMFEITADIVRPIGAFENWNRGRR